MRECISETGNLKLDIKGARVFQPVVQRTGKSVLPCLAFRKGSWAPARRRLRHLCPQSAADRNVCATLGRQGDRQGFRGIANIEHPTSTFAMPTADRLNALSARWLFLSVVTLRGGVSLRDDMVGIGFDRCDLAVDFQSIVNFSAFRIFVLKGFQAAQIGLGEL